MKLKYNYLEEWKCVNALSNKDERKFLNFLITKTHHENGDFNKMIYDFMAAKLGAWRFNHE